jgi:hypothetical protein
MSDRNDLLALGFVDDGSGTLRIRADVALTPLDDGRFFRAAIALPHGGELACIVPAAALKIGPPTETVVDVDAMISNTVRPRPW